MASIKSHDPTMLCCQFRFSPIGSLFDKFSLCQILCSCSNIKQFIFKPGVHRLLMRTLVCMCVCVCVSAPQAMKSYSCEMKPD